MIRKMKHSDIYEVAMLEKECFVQPWSEKSLDSEVEKENSLFYVVEIEKKIVGYMGMYLIIDEGDITNIAISQMYRNKGYATELINEAMKEANKRNIHKFTLEVRESNKNAISLYNKLGFKSVGIRKNFYDFPNEDAIIMWKC